MEDSTLKICTLIQVKYGWKTKMGEDVNELSRYPIGRLMFLVGPFCVLVAANTHSTSPMWKIRLIRPNDPVPR